MNIASRQWSSAAGIPVKNQFVCASGVICGDLLYVLGEKNSNSVYSCSLSDLLESRRNKSNAATPRHSDIIWKQLADLPLYYSACVSLCGHILAISGNLSWYNVKTSIKVVYACNPTTNSWKVMPMSPMSVARHHCFAVTLPTTNELMVASGWKSGIF